MKRIIAILSSLTLLGAVAPAVADTAADIAAQEARIAALQKEVAPLVAPLQTIHSDVRVFASLDPLVAAIAGLNQLSAGQRTVTLQSTRANGHFVDRNDWCNSYAELQGPGDLHAQGELTHFSASIENDGSIVLGTHAATSGHIQVHLQILGPRIYPPWPLPRGGGACPYGGGNGTSVGAGFSKDLDLRIRIAFAMAPNGQSLTYSAVLFDPAKVDVTVSIGLGALGNLGYPISFNVPQIPYVGAFPLLISNGGKFTIPGEKGSREYALALKPASFTATRTGVVAEWSSAIDFRMPIATR